MHRSFSPPRRTAITAAIGAATVLASGTAYLTYRFGVAPLVIVGIPGAPAYWLWYASYVRGAADPRTLLPAYLLTVAGFALHAIEEQLGHYGPSVGRLFGFAWTDRAFTVVVLALLGGLTLAGAGLYHRVRVAAFVALVFIATRLAEVALFVFPFIPPAIAPGDPAALSRHVAGTWVEGMPNYYLATSGRYYFPGMHTVALTMAPAAYALWRIWSRRRSAPTPVDAECGVTTPGDAHGVSRVPLESSSTSVDR